MRENAVDELHQLAGYIEGLSEGLTDRDGQQPERLARVAYWLQEFVRKTCGQGYVGCRGGRGMQLGSQVKGRS